MLKNKNFNIVLAIVIAVALWAYVLGDVNPTTKVTVRDVPIEFINEDVLENSGLTILECSQVTVNISVSGSRTEATKVDASDFNVEADVEALQLGHNVVRLNVKGPNNVEIVNVSADKIDINVDQLVTVSKNISVIATGNVDSDMEPYIVDMSKDSVNITGAKSLVNKVNRVNAVIDASKIGNTLKTLSAKLEPVDSAGKLVEGVILADDSINTSVVMHHKKTVTLEVPINNGDDTSYERSISVPKTIVIIGEDDVLAKITSIKCEEIDMSAYAESTSVILKPILPNGIQVGTDSQNLKAEITVKALSKSTIRVSNNNIKLENASNTLEYEVVIDDMTIEVQGKESDLIGLDISSFNITADVKGLESGTHTVKVEIECQKNVVSIKPSTEEITIIVK